MQLNVGLYSMDIKSRVSSDHSVSFREAAVIFCRGHNHAPLAHPHTEQMFTDGGDVGAKTVTLTSGAVSSVATVVLGSMVTASTAPAATTATETSNTIDRRIGVIVCDRTIFT